MSLGTNTPIEIGVQGRNLKQDLEYAEKVKAQLERITYLRDVQFGLPLDYPSLQIDYDRLRTAQVATTKGVPG